MTARKRATKADSGSPPTGEPEYLVVGILNRAHGLRGEMLMKVVTDFPERLKPGVKVFLGHGHKPCIIGECRIHTQGMLIRFQGIGTSEAAGAYRNQSVYVLSADRPRLPEGQYYHHELLGLKVIDEGEQLIGALVEILETGANDVYVIKGADERELLLPAIPGVVLGIDLRRRLIRVHVPDGIETHVGG